MYQTLLCPCVSGVWPHERAPGSRARVALTGITLAEYFRDHKGKDVLLFIDNIVMFTQASSEKSAFLGCIPSTLGYQPNLANQHEYHTGENHPHLEGLHLVLVAIVT